MDHQVEVKQGAKEAAAAIYNDETGKELLVVLPFCNISENDLRKSWKNSKLQELSQATFVG